MSFFSKRKSAEVLPVIDVAAEDTIENELYDAFFALRTVYRAASSVPGLTEYVANKLSPKLMIPATTGNMEAVLGIVMSDPVIGPLLHRVTTSVKENL